MLGFRHYAGSYHWQDEPRQSPSQPRVQWLLLMLRCRRSREEMSSAIPAFFPAALLKGQEGFFLSLFLSFSPLPLSPFPSPNKTSHLSFICVAMFVPHPSWSHPPGAHSCSFTPLRDGIDMPPRLITQICLNGKYQPHYILLMYNTINRLIILYHSH